MKRVLINNIEEKLSIAGKQILENKENISNIKLNKIAEEFGIPEIYYYSKDGVVLYSVDEKDIGWKAKPGDPIYIFNISNKSVFHEDIRKGTDTDENYKFSYFKDSEGNFVQLGYYAEEIKAITGECDYQSIVSEIAENQNVYYALITDKNMVAIADSDKCDVGLNWSDEIEYQNALKGISSVVECYYGEIDDIVYEVSIPLIIENEMVGVFAIGQSMDNVNNIIWMAYLRIFILFGVVSFLLVWIQRKNIILPITRLNNELKGIDVGKNKFVQLSVDINDPFLGVKKTINSLLCRTEEHFEELKEINFKLDYVAHHDYLTGLKNRQALHNYLNEKLQNNCSGAVLMLSVNNFKEINDVYGHEYGDSVIKLFAQKLEKLEKGFECFRFSEDKFIIVLLDDKSNSDKQIIDTVNAIQDITLANKTFHLSCSIGISKFPEDDNDLIKLIQMANVALEHVKINGKDIYAYFISTMSEILLEKNKIYNHLKYAIENDNFYLVYQPIIETSTEEAIYFEALLRLEGSTISPGQFIPIAEEKSLITTIGNIVIEKVINQLWHWKNSGYEVRPISINVSPRHFNLVNLYDFVVSTLEKYEIEPSLIELEVTEEVLVEDIEKFANLVDRFYKLGISTSLDDFGSGYASFNYLTTIPFNKIKLDKTFIDKFLETNNSSGLINSIVEICHELGILVVAEGIENENQHKILREIGCDYEQGYLFSKPLMTSEAERLLKKEK